MIPIIGIIMRKDISQTGKKIDIAYEDIISSVIKSGGLPIAISEDYFNKYINICHGYILQGGDDISNNNLKIIKELIKKNIPTLGICLGMQEMATINNGKLSKIDNHFGNTLHEIKIDNNSLLYKILGVTKTIVNSRHNEAVLNTNLKVSSMSYDNIIESVEDDKLTFFLGVQWHPENTYDIDLNSKKIFDYFIKICHDN